MADAKRGGRGGLGSSGQLSKDTVPSRLVHGQDFTLTKEEVFPIRTSLVAERGKKAVKLYANYFQLIADKTVEVSKYNFTILGGRELREEIKGASARQIFKSALIALRISPHEYATDYKQQIVTLNPLTLPEDERQLTVDGCVVKFGNPVQVRLDTSVSGTPSQDVIDCLNLIIGQYRRGETTTMATIGRHRFFPRSEKKFSAENNLGDLFETTIPEMLSVSRGFFQGVRPAVDQLLLNVNVTFGVFRPHGEIRDLYRFLNNRYHLADNPGRRIEVLSQLHQVISRARVSYTIPGVAKAKANGSPPTIVPIAGFARRTDKSRDKQYPLEIVSDFPGPEQATFLIKEGDQDVRRSVKDHFRKKYGVVIDSGLPLINKGRPNKPEYVPAEYCKLIWGQPLRHKVTEIPGLSDTDLQNLNHFTCRGPEHSRSWIESAGHWRHMFYNRSQNQVLQKFHVNVGSTLLEISGRELSAPVITYTGTEQIRPKDGSWPPRAKEPSKTGILRSWTWIQFGGFTTQPPGNLENGVNELKRHLERVCGECPAPEQVQSRCITMAQGIASLSQELGRAKVKGVQLVVLILPSRLPLETYSQVKFLGDIRHGVHTSCVLRGHFTKANWNYFANVALKINLKLGGVNHKLSKPHRLFQGAGTMVVGYDVTHPTGSTEDSNESKCEESGAGESAPEGTSEAQSQSRSTQAEASSDSKKEQSQVGLVASVNQSLGQWWPYYWNQTARQEMTDKTLTEAFVSRLEAWKWANGSKLPENIVIYRDGVSESQFDQVLKKEVPMIRKACSGLYAGTKPRITIVVAVKRHTVRLFPKNGKANKEGQVVENIRPGTVVDSGVTQKRYWEFYLAAHAAIRGTTKPTRYVVVLDEIFSNEYSENGAEQLELFTHDLSYVYGRATRAVSVCTPAYYADILCTRARAYMSALDNERFKFDIRTSIAGDSRAHEERIMDGRIHPDLENSMYWI